jgi:hypothetical protein
MPSLRAVYRRPVISITAVLACAMSKFVTATTVPDAEASDPAKLG